MLGVPCGSVLGLSLYIYTYYYVQYIPTHIIMKINNINHSLLSLAGSLVQQMAVTVLHSHADECQLSLLHPKVVSLAYLTGIQDKCYQEHNRTNLHVGFLHI